MNAANAVLVPSEREGFGLAVLEALACDVPVLATPVGVAPEALAGVSGTLCAPYDRERWRAALAPHLAAADPRIAGRAARRALLERRHGRTRARRLARASRTALALRAARRRIGLLSVRAGQHRREPLARGAHLRDGRGDQRRRLGPGRRGRPDRACSVATTERPRASSA